MTTHIEPIYDDDFMLSRLIARIDKKCVKINVIPPNIETNRKTKRTYIYNFDQFSTSVRRDRQHIKLYLEAELNTETSITEAGMLIIDKPFDSKRVESILQQYVEMYIVCKESKCRSLSTIFIKEDRINYLTCEQCNSRHAINLKIANMQI